MLVLARRVRLRGGCGDERADAALGLDHAGPFELGIDAGDGVRIHVEIDGHLADGRELVAVFAGGAVGSLCRALLAEAYPTMAPSWPWVTFAVNLSGAFLLGYFAVRLRERLPVSMYRRPLLGTGFCGAFTTFSTMQVELLRMLDTGDAGLAAAYALVSVVAGLSAVELGTAAVRRA